MIMGGFRKKEDELEFYKDAGMLICKVGHLATRKVVRERKVWE